MHIRKAVITAAGRKHPTLPLQMLMDRDGRERSVLGILVKEVMSAGIEEIAVIVPPGEESRFAKVVGNVMARLHFIPQPQALGYGHAVYCANGFVGDEPFLHLVGDHLYVSGDNSSCARQLVEMAQAESCAVSAVQPTRESLLPYFGAVGGRHLPNRKGLYQVETVIEKPTPTEAEYRLLVSGLRAGHYLCFFGMHALTPTVMEILARQVMHAAHAAHAAHAISPLHLSGALSELAKREKYLAMEQQSRRYDVGVRYGLLTAQIALALEGVDREQVLVLLLELLAQRQLGAVRE